MRARASALVVLAVLLGGSPARAYKVRLEGEIGERCREWSKSLEAAELQRTEGLASSEAERQAWAAARRAKATALCEGFQIHRSCGCGKCSTAAGEKLPLPAGFLEGLGIDESDLHAWASAESAGAEFVFPRSAVRERLMRDPASGCSSEPGGIGSEGDWIWCRSSRDDPPYASLKRKLSRGAAIVAGICSLLGLGALALMGRNAARRREEMAGRTGSANSGEAGAGPPSGA